MEEDFPWKLASSSNIQKEDHHRGRKVGSFTIPSLQNCGQPIADGTHGIPEQDFGAPIYDEYEDYYWGDMPERTDAYLINLGLDRERNAVSEINASPGILGPSTSC